MNADPRVAGIDYRGFAALGGLTGVHDHLLV
jgi:hypothetical protein